jgi:cytochrome c peroxidase
VRPTGIQPRMCIATFWILSVSLALIDARTARAAGDEEAAAARPIGRRVTIKAPLGLPPVPIPPDNPPTAETIALGRRLFYEPALSVDGTVACASCHNPTLGFADNKPVATGVQAKTGIRSAPSVINRAYDRTLFWDGRAPDLEKQVEGPIQNPLEMAQSLDGVVKRLQASERYREEFAKAWGSNRITIEMVTKSIATFERTVLSGNSPFDRYYYGGDQNALSASARRGLRVFTDPKRGNCAACHLIGKNYALFTDHKFHNLGIGANTDGTLTDPGRYSETKNDADMGAFKTPSLRNVTLTAPYMHDGSMPRLKDVIDHYIGGGNSNPHLDKKIHVLDFLSGRERGDLLEFLESLTGPLPPDVGPPVDMKPTLAAQ